MADIYLDHNATTPLAPEVLEAMLPWFGAEGHGNPSCAHRLGRRARQGIEEAREEVASFFGCARDEVYFTSGGTEANNMAVKGAAWARQERGRHLVVGAGEHPSVSDAARFLTRFGFELTEVPVDSTGQVQPEQLLRALRPDTVLVSIMTAQNVVGTINRMDELAEVVRGRGIWLHTDAAQAATKVPCSFPFLGADLMTVAGHKMYGPKGVGALIVRRGCRLDPLLHGAGHERGARSGTENTAGAIGLAAALRLARRTMADVGERVVALRDGLHLRLAEALPGVVLNGHPLDRLPNTLNLSFLGVTGAAIAERVPELLLATGPACHDRAEALSPTFKAMGLGPARGSSSLRISLGRSNTWEEIDRAAELLIEAVRALRDAAPALPEEARQRSARPLCPRCGTDLQLDLARLAPAVTCQRHPGCRYEAYLAPPPGVEAGA